MAQWAGPSGQCDLLTRTFLDQWDRRLAACVWSLCQPAQAGFASRKTNLRSLAEDQRFDFGGRIGIARWTCSKLAWGKVSARPSSFGGAPEVIVTFARRGHKDVAERNGDGDGRLAESLSRKDISHSNQVTARRRARGGWQTCGLSPAHD